MPGRNARNDKRSIGLWDMVRDVAIASMNKGQFPMAIAGAVVLSIIWKMPSGDVSKLAFQIFADIKSGCLVGYIVSGVAILGWFLHARSQRRLINSEMDRISKERTKLQERQIGAKLSSSERG